MLFSKSMLTRVKGHTLVVRGLFRLVKDRKFSILTCCVVFDKNLRSLFIHATYKTLRDMRHYVTSSTKVDPEFVRKLI